MNIILQSVKFSENYSDKLLWIERCSRTQCRSAIVSNSSAIYRVRCNWSHLINKPNQKWPPGYIWSGILDQLLPWLTDPGEAPRRSRTLMVRTMTLSMHEGSNWLDYFHWHEEPIGIDRQAGEARRFTTASQPWANGPAAMNGWTSVAKDRKPTSFLHQCELRRSHGSGFLTYPACGLSFEEEFFFHRQLCSMKQAAKQCMKRLWSGCLSA